MTLSEENDKSRTAIPDVIVSRACPCCGSPKVVPQRMMDNSQILECQECAAAFSAAVPAEGEVRAIYEQLYAHGSSYQPHRDEVVKMAAAIRAQRRLRVGWEQRQFFRSIAPLAGARLLDIGCGTGFFLLAAAQRGWDSCGVEPSSEAANLGKEVHKRPVSTGRIESVKFQRGGFAAVTAWEVMEHLPEPLAFLRQISEFLSPDGIFAGSVPNYARPRYRYGADLGVSSRPPVHLNFWTPASLEALLQKAGFQKSTIYVPRLHWDVLRPLRRISGKKVARFLKIALKQDLPTTMAFHAKLR